MGLVQDVRFGSRMLRRDPWLTLVAILMIAFGIGINSTVFSLANAVFFKSLPFQEPEEIVHIGMTAAGGRSDISRMSFPEIADFRSKAKSLDSLAAFAQNSFDVADSVQSPERYSGLEVSSNLFSFLGIRPIRGRDFTVEDERPGAEPVALIGYGVWQSRYGSREDIVGLPIRVDARSARIVGVMPPGMAFPNNERLWMPLVPSPADDRRDYRHIDVIGRLASGVSLSKSRAELNSIAAQLERDFPATNKGRVPAVMSYNDWSNGPELILVFLTMLGAVGFVLLIACGNVASLLLSRVIERSKETSIRTALGATRWQIVRQFLVESLIMSFLGGFVGLLLAQAGIRWWEYAVANVAQKPYYADFAMDYRVFAYFLFVCVAAAIAFGVAPALQMAKTDVNTGLKENGRGATGFRTRRLATTLLIGEVALTTVLLVGAGLLVRAVVQLQTLDIGVETRDLATAAVLLPESRYPTPESRSLFVDRLLDRLEENKAAKTAVAAAIPLRGSLSQTLQLRDRDLSNSDGSLPQIGILPVDNAYFQTLGLRVNQGRDFNRSDGQPGIEVAIVNQPFASQYWPGESAVGKRLQLGNASSPWLTIVGVSPAVYQSGTSQRTPAPLVYVPFRESPVAEFSLLMRSPEGPTAAISLLRSELAGLDSDLPLFDITTVDEYLRSDMWPQRVIGTLFGAFAIAALLMSAIGLYGVTAYGVVQRKQEFGIRMALGATSTNVVGLVLWQSLKPMVAGLSLGLIGATLVSGLLTVLLFGVSPTDPVAFVSAGAVLLAVTLTACLVPARRATRLDPLNALRAE